MRHEALVVEAGSSPPADWSAFRDGAIRDGSYVSVTVLAGQRAVRILPPTPAKSSPGSLLIPSYSDAPDAESVSALVDMLFEAEAAVDGLDSVGVHVLGAGRTLTDLTRALHGSSVEVVPCSTGISPGVAASALRVSRGMSWAATPIVSTAWTWRTLGNGSLKAQRLEYSGEDTGAACALAGSVLQQDVKAEDIEVRRPALRRGLFKKQTVAPAVIEVTERLTPQEFSKVDKAEARVLCGVAPVEAVNRARRSLIQGFVLQSREDGELWGGSYTIPGVGGRVSSRPLRRFEPEIEDQLYPGATLSLARTSANVEWVATLASGARFVFANGPGNNIGPTLDRHVYCSIPVAAIVYAVFRDPSSSEVQEIRVLFGSKLTLDRLASG